MTVILTLVFHFAFKFWIMDQYRILRIICHDRFCIFFLNRHGKVNPFSLSSVFLMEERVSLLFIIKDTKLSTQYDLFSITWSGRCTNRERGRLRERERERGSFYIHSRYTQRFYLFFFTFYFFSFSLLIFHAGITNDMDHWTHASSLGYSAKKQSWHGERLQRDT